MTVRRNPFLLVVLCGGIIMGLSLGIRHVQGLFLLPVTTDRAWSREAFAFAFAMQNLVWGLAQPFTGMIADRFGALRVVIGGMALYACGLVLMAVSSTPLQFSFSAGLLVGIALSCTSFGTIYGALSRMVPEQRRPWALGLAGAVGGLAQFLMVPFAQGLLSYIQWGVALGVLALIIALASPAALMLRDNVSEAAGSPKQSMGEAIREAFAHRGFWLLNFGFLACGFQLAFIASHMPAYLLDQGLRAADAMASLAIIALTNIAGTYYGGVLGGLFRRKYLLTGLYLMRSAAIALFVLLPISSWSAYLFSAAMGFLWLGTVPLTNGLIAQIFGVRYLTTLFGFVFIGHQLGSFFGVWLGGWAFDATRSYDIVWFVAIALGLIAAALHWPINDREIVRVSTRTVEA